MQSVVVVRHCETSGQDPEAPLTEAGRAQALQLAARLSPLPIDHIVSSPYARAVGSVEPFATRAKLSVHLDDRLAERRLSPEPIDNWRDVIQRSFEDLDSGVPGGETGRETLTRGWDAIQAVLRKEYRLPLVVTHGHLLSLVLHSIDSSFGFTGWASLRNPDVYLLERKPDETFVFCRL